MLIKWKTSAYQTRAEVSTYKLTSKVKHMDVNKKSFFRLFLIWGKWHRSLLYSSTLYFLILDKKMFEKLFCRTNVRNGDLVVWWTFAPMFTLPFAVSRTGKIADPLTTYLQMRATVELMLIKTGPSMCVSKEEIKMSQH